MVILRQNKNIKQILMAFLMAVAPAVMMAGSANAAYYCRSEECLAAQAREQAYQEKANEFNDIADTYEAAVARLNNEIAAVEASIAANQALANDIAAQIEETKIELLKKQEALAELLVNMHFGGDNEPIKILASSSSISDLAEKQAREEVAKKEIAAASEKVKELKASLEDQKATVDSLIAEQNVKRSEVAEKRAEQAELMAKFQNDAAAYESYAATARSEKQALMDFIAEETATCNYTGYTTTAYGNNYPYASSCPAWPDFYPYAGMMCQCTSYAGWKAMSTYGISFSSWGNANNWGWYYDGAGDWGEPRTYKDGYRVDTVVEPGTVAVSNCGEYGHVMWVESVNYEDGTINVSEYNNYGSNIFHRAADFGARTHVSVAGLRFIHFR